MQMQDHQERLCAPQIQMNRPTPYIRGATAADVPAIVQLQTMCLSHFHLVDPGPAYLRNFYSFLLDDPAGLLFVSEQDHQLAGFVAGFSDPSHLHQRVASRRFRIFAAASACLVKHPIQLSKFLDDLHRARRLKSEPGSSSETACELLTIAVNPRLRRQGHGKALVLALAEAAKCNKMDQLRVHIGSEDDGMASFYRRLGFRPSRTFLASDARRLDEYVLAIEGNGKVN